MKKDNIEDKAGRVLNIDDKVSVTRLEKKNFLWLRTRIATIVGFKKKKHNTIVVTDRGEFPLSIVLKYYEEK